MPLVRIAHPPRADMTALLLACREIVPAGFNSPMGQLTPGSIVFISNPTDPEGLTVDFFVEIEAFRYQDRENLDERAEAIKAALREVFPDVTFAVWAKLVTAGWASDSIDPEFDGDMSMEAAIKRAQHALGERDFKRMYAD